MIASIAACLVIACIVVMAGVISVINNKSNGEKQTEETTTVKQTEVIVNDSSKEDLATTVWQPRRVVEEEPSRANVPAQIICEATTNSSGEKIIPKKKYLSPGGVSFLYNWINPYDNKCYEYAYGMDKNSKGYISPNENRSAVVRGLEPGEYKEIRGHLLITAYNKNDSVEGQKVHFRLEFNTSDGSWNRVYDLFLPVGGEPFSYSSYIPDDVVSVGVFINAPDIPICAYIY